MAAPSRAPASSPASSEIASISGHARSPGRQFPADTRTAGSRQHATEQARPHCPAAYTRGVSLSIGIVGMPDPRLDALAGLHDSAKIVPATVRFVDIAGLVRGASQGQGLGNQFLSHIRETDSICQVVRVFTDPDVSHVDGDVSPERDIETIATELMLADLQTLEKAAPRLAKEAKFARDRDRVRI